MRMQNCSKNLRYQALDNICGFHAWLMSGISRKEDEVILNEMKNKRKLRWDGKFQSTN